jgi:hypothetical protein
MTISEERDMLKKAGLLHPCKRGRRPLYNTEEERIAARRAQKRACQNEYRRKFNEAKAQYVLMFSRDTCMQFVQEDLH